MPAKQGGIVRQLHHALYGLLEISMVRIWQIGTPHRTSDDEVAADEDLFVGKEVANVARGVSRCMNDVHLKRTDLEFLAIDNVRVGNQRRNNEGQLKYPCLARGISDLSLIQAVDKHLGIWKSSADARVISKVVKVTMC